MVLDPPGCFSSIQHGQSRDFQIHSQELWNVYHSKVVVCFLPGGTVISSEKSVDPLVSHKSQCLFCCSSIPALPVRLCPLYPSFQWDFLERSSPIYPVSQQHCVLYTCSFSEVMGFQTCFFFMPLRTVLPPLMSYSCCIRFKHWGSPLKLKINQCSSILSNLSHSTLNHAPFQPLILFIWTHHLSRYMEDLHQDSSLCSIQEVNEVPMSRE